MLKFSAYSCLTSDNRISFTIKSSRILLQLPSLALSLKAIGSMSGLNQPIAITATFRRWGREFETHPATCIKLFNYCIVKSTLKQTYLSLGGGADCFRNSNDSRSAIRIAYRTLLRSSSIWEPRHPPLKVLLLIYLLVFEIRFTKQVEFR